MFHDMLEKISELYLERACTKTRNNETKRVKRNHRNETTEASKTTKTSKLVSKQMIKVQKTRKRPLDR